MPCLKTCSKFTIFKAVLGECNFCFSFLFCVCLQNHNLHNYIAIPHSSYPWLIEGRRGHVAENVNKLSTSDLLFTHSLIPCLNDRWGIKDDRATTFSPFLSVLSLLKDFTQPNPVHSNISSSSLFSCLPFLLPPCTVPCRIIFASLVDLVMCPYHFSLIYQPIVFNF